MFHAISPYFQACLAIATFASFLALQKRYKPFLPPSKAPYRPDINKMEEQWMLAVIMILISGIVFSQLDKDMIFYSVFGWITALVIALMYFFFFFPAIKEMLLAIKQSDANFCSTQIDAILKIFEKGTSIKDSTLILTHLETIEQGIFHSHKFRDRERKGFYL